MKKIIAITSLLCLSVFSNLYSQFSVPGACDGNCGSSRNGNGTLGQIYNNSACGLNYTQTSMRMGQRFTPAGAPQPAAFNMALPPCITAANGAIDRAYIWISTSGNGAAVNVTVQNPQGVSQTFPMTLVGQGPDKCWGYTGTYTYRADVTPIVTNGGNYIISGLPTGSPNDADGATFMIIYRDPAATYRGSMVIHDGTVMIGGGSTTQTVTGIAACAPGQNARAFCAIGDIQMTGQTLTMNGTNAPFMWDWYNYVEVPTNVALGQNTANYTLNSGGDCYNLLMIGLYYQTNTCAVCPANNPLQLNMASTNATCSQCNGSATVTASGVAGPYTYSWAPTGGNGPSATNLCAGTYTVTVTGGGGCFTNTATVTITNQGSGITIAGTTTDVLCNGGNTGAINTTVSGVTGPINYNWSPSGGTGSNANNLFAGIYTVIVSDTAGCADTSSFTVNQPPLLTVSLTSPDNQLCLGDSTVLTALASGGAGTSTYTWNNSIPAGTTSHVVSPGTTTNYIVTVTDSNNCTATNNLNVTVSPIPVASFNFVNACSGLPSSFTSTSTISSGNIAGYAWNYGDNTPFGTTANTTHTYAAAGNYPVTLGIVSNMGCVDSITQNLLMFPGPVINFSVDTPNGCVNHCVNFTDLSTVNGSTITQWSWLANGVPFSAATNPAHCFTNPGLYNIGLMVQTADGCIDTVEVPNFINAYSLPQAGFTLNSYSISFSDPLVEVHDEAVNTTSWQYNMGDGTLFFSANPVHLYGDSGTYCITQIVTSSNGCKDTTVACLDIYLDPLLYIPNSFTPNGDGLNEIFSAKGVELVTFEMRIFDRWGMEIFYSNDMSKGWNGQRINGSLCMQDVYVYKVSATDINGDEYELMGQVNLIR